MQGDTHYRRTTAQTAVIYSTPFPPTGRLLSQGARSTALSPIPHGECCVYHGPSPSQFRRRELLQRAAGGGHVLAATPHVYPVAMAHSARYRNKLYVTSLCSNEEGAVRNPVYAASKGGNRTARCAAGRT